MFLITKTALGFGALTTNIEDVTAQTFNGVINGANSTTFQSGDILNGQKATNTLNLTIVDGADASAVAEMNGVQVVNIRNVSGGVEEVDASLWDGATQIWNSRSTASSDVEVTGVAAATAVGVRNSTAAMTVTYAEGALGSKTATQTIALDGADESVVTVNAAGTDAFTAVTIAASGADSDISIQLNNGEDVSAIKTLAVTGTAAVGIDFVDVGLADDNDVSITTIDASGNSGGVTFDATNATGLKTLTGGTGDDVFTIGGLAASATVSLGNGDDQLLAGGDLAALASTVTVDGGAGTDTIAATMLASANAKNIKNFEILELAGATGTIDGSLYTASTFESLQLTAATAGAVTVSKLAGTAIVLDVTNTEAMTDEAAQAEAITATLATATGTADTATINFAGEANATIAEFITTGVETVNIVSGGDEDIANELTLLTLNDNSTTSIVITGAENFKLDGVETNATATLTATQASALTLIDGSAATGNLAITAGASHTVSDNSVTYNSLTINGGAGDDVISIGGRGSVDAGEGEDTVNVAVLGVSVTFASDDELDSVALGSAARIAGTAAVVDPATAAVAPVFTATTRVTTVSGMAEDDTINITEAITTAADTVNDFTTAAGGEASLVDAVNAAIADDASDVDFFTWADGNTYLVANGTATVGEVDDTLVATVLAIVGTYTDFTIAEGVVTFA